MNGSFWSEEILDNIISSAGLYRTVGWIVSYCWLDHIISAGLDRIVLAGSGNAGFYALDDYWMDGTDRHYHLPERERHHWLLRGGGLWEVVAGTKCIGAARTRKICVGEAK